MPTFHYIALDSQGQQITGYLEAKHQAEAIYFLRSHGYYPIDIQKTEVSPPAEKLPLSSTSSSFKKSTSWFNRKKLSSKTQAAFTRQLATLVHANLPLLKSLTLLATQEKNTSLRTIITQLAESIQRGNTFSESLQVYPKIFSPLYINMVRAGESGGILGGILLRLADFQEKAHRLKRKIMVALFYPMVVLCLALLILSFLIVFIIPRFEVLFTEILNGQPLPWSTQVLLATCHFGTLNFLKILSILGVFTFLLKFLLRTKKGEQIMDQISTHLPLFGNLKQKNSIAHFARTFGTLLTSGIPILQALFITHDTLGKGVIAKALPKIYSAVQEGESLAFSLKASDVFPLMVTNMVHVGEETGDLSAMLTKIADIYEEEVHDALISLTSLLEPLLIVLLALIIGTIVIALFLPLIHIIQGLNGL